VQIQVTLVIDWEKCDNGDTKLDNPQDVLDCVRAYVVENADYDGLDLGIKSAFFQELT